MVRNRLLTEDFKAMKQFYLYSRIENSFYPVQAPSDAVLITDETHHALFEGQSKGLAINANKHGYPINIRQGEKFEEWHPDLETWVMNTKAFAAYEKAEAEKALTAAAAEKVNALQVRKDELHAIENKITWLERIKDRTELEEQELDALIDQSTVLFREIRREEETLNDRNA